MESVNPNTYFLLVLRLWSNGQAQTRKALYINVMFSNDIILMSFLLAALTVLRIIFIFNLSQISYWIKKTFCISLLRDGYLVIPNELQVISFPLMHVKSWDGDRTNHTKHCIFLCTKSALFWLNFLLCHMKNRDETRNVRETSMTPWSQILKCCIYTMNYLLSSDHHRTKLGNY